MLGAALERQHWEGADVHTQSSEEQSIRSHGMQRDPCSTPPSAILIPTSEPAVSVGFFTTTKAEVTTFFFSPRSV